MNIKLSCFLLLALATLVASQVSKDRNRKRYKVVCYLGSWANYRKGNGKFIIEHIDPFLCTHVVYGFAKLAGNSIKAYDPYLDVKENWGLGAFSRFNNLKKANPQLSTLIAIGGWNEGSVKYSKMAANRTTRAIFIQSVLNFLEKYEFDGLDMDWEYPANRGGKPEDKQNFVLLLKELKEAFRPQGYILSAAVSAGQKTIDKAYDIRQVATYLDIINVMAYDLHGSWENVTGHNAPLYERPEESDEDKILNVDYAINYWIKNGAPRNKVVLGMGLYGRSFTLKDPTKNGIGAPVKAPGRGGVMTREPGMLGYNEICLLLKQGWKSTFVNKIEAPYAYSGDQWVGYDDKRSIGIKVDYLIRQNLGGGMVWSVETDDFRGTCAGEKYPLLTLIATKLNGPIVRPTAPPVRPTLPPPDGSTKKPGFKCTREGYFRDPTNCARFFYCAKTTGNEYSRKAYHCGEDSAFDEVTSTCTFRNRVPGC